MAIKYQNLRKKRIQRRGDSWLRLPFRSQVGSQISSRNSLRASSHSGSRAKYRFEPGSRLPRRSAFKSIRAGLPRKRRRGSRRARLHLPYGISVSRKAILFITLLAAVLLALGLRPHFSAIRPSDNLQTSVAKVSDRAGTTDGVLSGTSGASAEFPADFSADLSIDPSSSFLAPLSRGGGTGNTVITSLAVSRLGDACFQQTAAPGDYLDCSALVQWCYSRLGVEIPRTAADQAEYCHQHRLTVSRSQLQCGDLIFWSFEKNDRFKDISHTGIYAGNGKIIDASYSRGQVVYRDLYSPEKIVMYGRIPIGR